MNRYLVSVLLVSGLGLGLGLVLRQPSPKPHTSRLSASSAYAYPYGSQAFDRLVSDSYQVAGKGSSKTFEQWWDHALLTQKQANAKDWIQLKRKQFAGAKATPEDERKLGEEVFGLVKKTITKFSLDRGFEFSNVVATGERQCLLQSVLIASMLQAIGLDAGLAMVWSNEKDEVSNLGHAATYLRLSDHQSVLLDASEPYPNPKHLGLFLVNHARLSYQFVRPSYGSTGEIVEFRTADRASPVPMSDLGSLDIDFVRSQFDFYRGERAPGGLLAPGPTPEGLHASESFLQRSTIECPDNPLAILSLGRVFLMEHRDADANKMFKRANELYKAFGWFPPGVGEPPPSIK